MAPGLIDSNTGLAYGSGLQWQTAVGGDGLAVGNSLASAFLEQWGPNGLSLSFTDAFFFPVTGFYGSAAIVGGGSGSGYNSSPDAASASLMTYTSPSPKMTIGPAGDLRFGAHNLYLNSASPADQSVTVVSGASYALTLTGSVQTTLSGAATGTITAGTTTFTAGTTTLTFGSTSGAGTVLLRRTPSDDTYMATAAAARYALPYEWDSSGNMLGLRLEEARTNVFLNSNVGATQSISVSATAYTLSFYGTGTITLSGVSTAGPLVGTGASTRVTLTFTPTAGSLTLTVSGTCSNVQLEAGSFATSYYPAYGSSQTRAVDNVNLATSVFPASTTAWSIYLEMAGADLDTTFLAVSNGTNSERTALYASGGTGRLFVADGGSTQAAVTTTVNVLNTAVHRMMGGIVANSFQVAVDGTLGTEDTNGTMPTVDRLYLGNSNATGMIGSLYMRAAMYIPRRAPNSQLQAVTTA